MTTGRRIRRALGACAAALALAAMPVLAAPRLAELPQRWLDDNGRELELNELAGERVVLTMAYASCHRICPATMASLKTLQQSLDARGETAAFVVVGYDPEHEDAAAWHQYRLSHRLGRANWHFLSGTPEFTERLARTLGFEFWKYDEHVMHGSRVLVFDAAGELKTALGPDPRGWAAAL